MEIEEIKTLLVSVYLEGCHESMRLETWEKERMPIYLKKLKVLK